MSVHTEQPWEVLKFAEKLNDYTGAQFFVRAPHAPGGLCIVIGGLGAPEEEANANLICAAPKMLEALKAITALFQYDHDEAKEDQSFCITTSVSRHMTNADQARIDHAMQLMDTAIAQAEKKPVEAPIAEVNG
jgi:hypothetical protein